MAATTSTSCATFFNHRATTVDTRVKSSQSQGTPGCGKVDGVAMWIINGVTTAFFASLERCSCIHIKTQDDTSDDANDLPLIFNDGNSRRDSVSSNGGGRRRTGSKGKKSGAFLDDH